MSLADDFTPERSGADPTAKGKNARLASQPRESCPYPLGSEERHEWLEGYDGVGSEGGALMPERKPPLTRS